MNKDKKITLDYVLYPIYMGVTLLICYFFANAKMVGDDIANHKAHLDSIYAIIHQVSNMYQTWSSRIFVNTIMFIFENIPYYWFVIVTGLLIFFAMISFDRLTDSLVKPSLVKQLLIGILFLLVPFYYFVTAGWIATTVTYLYPVLLLTVGLCLIIDFRQWYYNLPGMLLLLIAFNNEQLLVMGLVVAVTMLVYYFLHNKKLLDSIKLKLFSIGLPLLANFMIVAMCPGNSARKVAETKRWFPQFTNLTILEKFDIGLSTTIQHYLFFGTIALIALMLTFIVIDKGKDDLATISLVILLILLSCVNNLKNNPGLLANQTGLLNSSFKLFIGQYILAIFIFATVVYHLYKLSNHKMLLWLELSILSGGLLSRVALGFSPTNYASATRTFTFMTIGILVVMALLLFDNWNSRISKTLFTVLLISLVIFAIVNLSWFYDAAFQHLKAFNDYPYMLGLPFQQ